MKTKITILSMITGSFLLMNSLTAQNIASNAGNRGGSNNINNEQVTICHIPPGNHDNCHQITVSMNALQAHLDHGDKLFCYDELQYPAYLQIVDNNSELVIIMFPRNGF